MITIKQNCSFQVMFVFHFAISTIAMEFQFQQPQDKETKLKERANNKIKSCSSSCTTTTNTITSTNATTKNKFLGVRQRPSGKWVAEIKNTTQKIRVWLGTFDTAEEAARAYDEAAYLLRGSNTRTNFVCTPTSTNCNPALSRRIRNLVNQKRSLISSQPPPTPTSKARIKGADNGENTSLVLSQANNIISTKGQMLDQNVYRPDMSGQFDYSWAFSQQLPPIPNDMGLFQKNIGLTVSEPEMTNPLAIPEFERLKVERQISASLYAMNGVNDYLDNVFNVGDSSDPSVPNWDQPMLYHSFCLG